MNEKRDDIISKESNINPIVYKILNEAYHEFKQVHGEKHSNHIKQSIESITDKVANARIYYSGPIASAHPQMGVRFTKSDKLSAVLKHEMWHVYNNAASDRERSLFYIPQRYMKKLEENGYLREQYNLTMDGYKERFKDDLQTLNDLLKDFEEFKNNGFDFGDSHVEMWTEWFNSQTHFRDMQENFWEWGNGYFSKSYSSGSFYDCIINIAGMISSLIPREKLLDMYLQSKEYQTDYSYPEMLEEFDERYKNSLDEKERQQYKYPYLKIIMDIKTVYDNARKHPEVALNALQSCMKTCFNAYLQKLETIQDLDVEEAKKIYAEIKCMQEQMIWNVDVSKMESLDYIQALIRVQEKFRDMLRKLDLENPEVRQMLETIDYREDNPFKLIEGGERICEKIRDLENEEKNDLININGDYKANIGKNGIKDNLYRSLFVLLGNRKYNLLYEKFQGDTDQNILLRLYKQIEEATTEEDILNIYNSIYELYAQKLEDTLNTDENITNLFERYSREIVELQKNALFDEKNKRYLPGLEQIIRVYNQKMSEYEMKIDKVTEIEIQERMRRNGGITREEAEKNSLRLPNMYKKELKAQRSMINNQRESQALQYIELSKKRTKADEPDNEGGSYVITTIQIGEMAQNVPVQDKIEVNVAEQKGSSIAEEVWIASNYKE